LRGSPDALDRGRVQVYVDDLPVLVDGPVHVPPYTADLHVGLVDEPPVARRTTSEPGCVRREWCELLHPAEDRDMVDIDVPDVAETRPG
jgi:hypothetical protein